MNTKLLREVQRAIKKHPDQVLMKGWFGQYLELPDGPRAGGCGTAGCIAGWTIHVTSGNERMEDTREAYHLGRGIADDIAGELLHLNAALGEYDRLFFISSWPARFRKRYELARSRRGKAAAVSDRIDHFIKTKGKE